MIELCFSTVDIGRIRFAVTPVREAVAGIRALATASPHGLHAGWLRQIRPRLTEVDLDLLTALVRPAGYIPDFLVPAPRHPSPTVESGLAQIAATDPALVAEQIRHLAAHAVAQRGPGRADRVRLLDELIAAPDAGLGRVVAELDRWWRVAVAPHWPRMRALLHDDVTYRLEELANGGVQQLFRTLHPRISFSGDTLRIVKYYSGRAQLRQRGLLLMPCVFAWPDVLVGTADPSVSTLTYSPRGLGRLWQASDGTAAEPLAGVLGRGRAALLAQLDLPMSTSQLATLLDLAAPTVNAHLKALQAAGIVDARRDGHAVLYRRTRLGELLLAGAVGPAKAA
jgi:DNA-binding transcriptional ArsR family regulator